jgi:hypothetical protein
MRELGDFIVSMLDSADTVPGFLESHSSEYTPQNLLKKAQTKQY